MMNCCCALLLALIGGHACKLLGMLTCCTHGWLPVCSATRMPYFAQCSCSSPKLRHAVHISLLLLTHIVRCCRVCRAAVIFCVTSACSTASSVTVRSTIRRLREQVEA
jgi:hypothetical protein